MTFKKKALLPAIAMVLVSVVALTGVSYAWFSMSNSAEVGSLKFDVKAADGIQISADCSTFDSKVTLEEISDTITNANNAYYAGNKNTIPSDYVAPVSTDGTVTNGTFQMFTGELDGDNLLADIEAVNDGRNGAGAYYAFDVFFKMTSDKVVSLAAGSSITVDTGRGGVASKYTVAASRIAFLNLGNADTAAAARGLTGTAFNAENDLFIWEPSATVHTTDATDAGANGLVDTYGLKAAPSGPIDPKDFTTNSAYLGKLSASQIAESNGVTTAAQELFELKAGYNKVRIYVWIEGQDIDCDNSVSGNALNVVLNFSQPDTNA